MSQAPETKPEDRVYIVNRRMLHIICELDALETLPGEIVKYVDEQELTLNGTVVGSGETAASEGFVALLVTGRIPTIFLEWITNHEDVSDFSLYKFEFPLPENEDEDEDETE